VSIDLQKMVWQDPEPKGTAKMVLLCLASFVSHDAWKQGRDLLAWPSQNTVARRCGIQRSTVERSLEKLTEQGKIVDTGKRKTRRSVVYELYPSTAPDLPDYGASDLPDPAACDDLPDGGASESGGVSDLPDPANHLPDPAGPLARSCGNNLPDPAAQESKERGNGERSTAVTQAGASARDLDSDSDLAGELAEVEALLGVRPADKLLTRRRDELRHTLSGELAA
jgi:hypothetical protein